MGFVVKVVNSESWSKSKFESEFGNSVFQEYIRYKTAVEYKAMSGTITCTCTVYGKNIPAGPKTLQELRTLGSRGYEILVFKEHRFNPDDLDSFGWLYNERVIHELPPEYKANANKNPAGAVVRRSTGHRSYLVETKEQFKERLDRLMLEGDEEEDEYRDINQLMYSIRYRTKVEKDLSKVDFDGENVDTTGENQADRKFFGIQNIGDFNFVGCIGGGDWEEGVHYIIYWDGEDWRGYIPDKGNTYDKKTKKAYDGEPPSNLTPDYDEMISTIKKRFNL